MEASSTGSSTSAPSHDFLSKGLMAYEQPHATSNPSSGRMPLILGVAALLWRALAPWMFLDAPGNRSCSGCQNIRCESAFHCTTAGGKHCA